MADKWGPLGPLVGDWEAAGGLDQAFSHTRNEVLGTPYLERVSFKPFGPVDYEVTITIDDDDSWSYAEMTMLQMKEFDEPFAHSDHNTLRRAE